MCIKLVTKINLHHDARSGEHKNFYLVYKSCDDIRMYLVGLY
jgi:hypothetical protein